MSDSFEHARRLMIDDQLRGRDIYSSRVLTAMQQVPREYFVPKHLHHVAYEDNALPIDCGQTISQPYMVAAMTQALELSGDEHVLEVGTGSGYQAAVLSQLARSVVTVERHAALSDVAAKRLAALECHNVSCVVGDGTLGVPEKTPYDAILVAAATDTIPPALVEQLREGGRLVIPLGRQEYQMLAVVRKRGGKPVRTDLFPCRFVPLVADNGARENPF